MSKFKDAFDVITGRDLSEGTPKKKAPTKVTKKAEEETPKAEATTEESKEETKPAKKAEKPERTPVATRDAVFGAYDYAADKEALSKDVREALKTGSMSGDLRKLLQVLFDKKAVREIVAAQGDVRPPVDPNAYHVDFHFTRGDSDEDCNDAAEKLLEGGIPFEELEKFNIKLHVERIKEMDGSKEDGTDADYAEVIAKLTQPAA